VKVLICGAGVIGQVFAARLVQAGHQVTLLARGQVAQELSRRGITLQADGGSCHERPRIVTVFPRDGGHDLVLVTVRRDQVASIVPDLGAAGGQIVFLLNQCRDLEQVRQSAGGDRVLFGFPGVAGYRKDDGTVRYMEIRQQPTTIERRDGREQPVLRMLRSAGFRATACGDMSGWLSAHAVFITAAGAAILASGGDSVALAADGARVGEMVSAVGEGFRALARQGVTVVPTPLRLLFTVVPRFAAVRYWRRQLRGPVGTVAMAPHMQATGTTEFPVMCADVLQLVAGYGPAPHLDRLLRDRIGQAGAVP